MLGGGLSYEQPVATGKKISGFPSLTSFIQPGENLRSAWAGINRTNWTHTRWRKERIRRSLARSLPPVFKTTRSQFMMRPSKDKNFSNSVHSFLVRRKVGLREPRYPSWTAGAICVQLREAEEGSAPTSASTLGPVQLRKEDTYKTKIVDEGHPL